MILPVHLPRSALANIVFKIISINNIIFVRKIILNARKSTSLRVYM